MKPKIVITLSLTLSLLLLAAGPKPAAGEASEYAVKAAYLFNFAKFVTWPAGSAGSKVTIGIVGDDPFGDVLDGAVAGKDAGGKAIVVKRLGAYTAAAVRKCQILFISDSEKDKVSAILEALKGAPVLTVSETDHFAARGGAIQFDQEGQRITLDVNPDAAQKAGLTISSQLLQVAKIVKGGE